jgi:hypothetical protein
LEKPQPEATNQLQPIKGQSGNERPQDARAQELVSCGIYYNASNAPQRGNSAWSDKTPFLKAAGRYLLDGQKR